MPGKQRRKPYAKNWDAEEVRALRRHMGLSQDALAGELGTRQQTVSEWEMGRYRPRGASARLLSIVAERAGFEYVARSRLETVNEKAEMGKDAGVSGHGAGA